VVNGLREGLDIGQIAERLGIRRQRGTQIVRELLRKGAVRRENGHVVVTTRQASVQPGYEIGRDDRGLTRREREVLTCLAEGLNLVQTGARLGVSKQRVDQLVKALEMKGAIKRNGDEWVIVVRRNS